MQAPASFMDLSVPDINLGVPQNSHEGASELLTHPELIAEHMPWKRWEIPAPPEVEPLWTTTGTTEIDQQTFGTMLASNRTRSGRRVNQPAVQNTKSLPINGLAAPVKVATKKRKRQNRQVNITCTGCYRGNSPSNNFIVLCDLCDAPWHQKCHSPNIDNEVIEIPEMTWLCITCKPEQRQAAQAKSRKKAAAKAEKTGHLKEQPMAEQEVGGSCYSEGERRAYLSSLSHDMLVQLVMKLSNKWPSVPMFPPDMEPVTDFISSPPAVPHNNQTSNYAPKTIPGSAFIDGESSSVNPLAMDSNHRTAGASSTTEPDPTAFKSPGGITPNQDFAATSHRRITTTAPQSSATTTLHHPSKTVLKLTTQAANTAKPARKTSIISWNSDLLTDDESSYSRSRPQSPTPFASRSSQVESHHGSDYDSEDYRAYPEPGQGFRVPSTPTDLDILAEDKDCPTFSHCIRSAKNVQTQRSFSSLGQRN
ncbi:hypothetical protein N7475_006324 [Penicillium sp. IBT 31633x]|nr:hypothetical protein N7475_006324 [Penicillium sp. IBT 31633x]